MERVTSGFPLLVGLSRPSKKQADSGFEAVGRRTKKIRRELRPDERGGLAAQEKLQEERRRSERVPCSDDATTAVASLSLSFFLSAHCLIRELRDELQRSAQRDKYLAILFLKLLLFWLSVLASARDFRDFR